MSGMEGHVDHDNCWCNPRVVDLHLLDADYHIVVHYNPGDNRNIDVEAVIREAVMREDDELDQHMVHPPSTRRSSL